MYIEGINLQVSINKIEEFFFYFPTQKSLNILPRTSSTPIKPTISPRKLEAILSSSATFSISLDFEICKKFFRCLEVLINKVLCRFLEISVLELLK